jgi:hypothetical protein
VHKFAHADNAEKQRTRSLPKLTRAARDPELQQAFVKRLQETRPSPERLEQVGEPRSTVSRSSRGPRNRRPPVTRAQGPGLCRCYAAAGGQPRAGADHRPTVGPARPSHPDRRSGSLRGLQKKGRARMTDHYEGDGYEFSIRLLDHRRLLVHVTRATLEFLAGGELVDQLSTLTGFMGLLRERALLAHADTGAARGARAVRRGGPQRHRDAEAFSSALIAQPRNRIEGGASEWRAEPRNRGPRSSFRTPSALTSFRRWRPVVARAAGASGRSATFCWPAPSGLRPLHRPASSSAAPRWLRGRPRPPASHNDC